jgi:AraC-like DNA-binding protein
MSHSPATATFSIRVIWPFGEAHRELGVTPESVREEVGLREGEALGPDARISVEATDRLLHDAVERTGRQDLGLIAALKVEAGHWDILEFAARSRSTLGEAMKCHERFVPLLCDAAEVSMETDRKNIRWTFGFKPPITMHPAAHEFIAAVNLIWARRATGAELPLREVWFMHERPETTNLHERIFGCDIRFEAPATSIVAARSVLELPLVKADSRLSESLDRVAEELLLRLPRPTGLHERIRGLIVEQLAGGDCNAKSVARSLGMSTRTLNRKLGEKGTGFRELLDETRSELAASYLKNPSLSIGEAAYLTGFANPQAFHRAFKRWFDTTPSAFRRKG